MITFPLVKHLLFLALLITPFVSVCFSEDRQDPSIVPYKGGKLISVLRSWQDSGFVDEFSTKEEPKQVAMDRLHLQPIRVKPEDRKFRLWIETHIGSEDIKESTTIGAFRFSPLKDFIEEENVSKDYLSNTNNGDQKQLRVTRISGRPYNGIAVSEGDGWRIERKIEDGRIKSPITFYLNGKKFYEADITSDSKGKN